MYKTPWLITLLLFALISSCSYTQKIKDGKTAVERKQYAVAVTLLQKEYNKSKSRVEKGKIAFLLGESYRRLNQSENSISWYKIAYDNQYGVEALREYAFGLKRAQRYKEAVIAFKDLGIEIGSPYEYRREIKACEIAQGWADIKYPEYEVDLLSFNTGFADYSPSLYKENKLVFTSDRSDASGKDIYNWTGNAFSDLFVVDLNSNSVSNFDSALNSDENEGTVAFNKDYSEVYFTRCYGGKKEDAYCKIMVSKVQSDGSWGIPQALPFVKDEINYGHPTLSADGKSLYFACNDSEGWGGFDIYVVSLSSEGWGEPKILSRSINTLGDEKFPFIDGDTLYFASNYHSGMGGLDIFRSYKLANGSWSPAFNLKPPINSGGDDFGYIVDYKTPKASGILQAGYFSSTRANGAGNDDIYHFKKIIPPVEPEPEPEPEQIVYKMILDGYVLEKIYEDQTNPNSTILGRKPLADAVVKIVVGQQTKSVTVGEDGLFSLELGENSDYEFLASKDTYLTNNAEFSTKGIGKDPSNPIQKFEVEIVLDKIFKNKEIRLENIYYDFDKWDIRDDAKPTLNELVENLKLNPAIRIQLGSHTDCRGNGRYNEDLSQKRAQSAVNYLISKGIEPNRLTAKGFGENALEIECICSRCTEEEHQSNRRTTFTIID